MRNNKLLTWLMGIICLTNVIALLFLPLLTKGSVSWICGSTLSLLNLVLLARKLEHHLNIGEKQARLAGYKNFNIRYLVLIIMAVAAVKLLKLDIIIFGLGLLSGQIWLFVSYLIRFPGFSDNQE
jgi:hypothetical protein